MGYTGYPYLNREYGKAQFIVRTELNKEKHCLEFTGLDTHLSGRSVWDTFLSGINVQPHDADPLTQRVVVKRASDGGGMAVVNLVNADVLPSFLENERVIMQMVAFPEEIHYYPDEEAYAADQPKGKNGKKWLLADGQEVGFALFFHNFSTFLGRAGIYLEDLYVKPEYRGRGYGKSLLKQLAKIAVERGCGRLEWWCLNWNQPSIDFYLSLGAEPMNDWTVYRIAGETLTELAQ